jgi:hypothetical protein
VALRGHFRRQLGASPAAYRAAYRARQQDGAVVGRGKPVADGYAPRVPGQRGRNAS